MFKGDKYVPLVFLISSYVGCVKKTDVKQQFGLKVKALRKVNKVTQADLAAEIDTDVRTIKRIESGNYNPTLEIVSDIARAFKISLSDLFK